MIIQTPEWVKDAVFYQIFPDRFAFAKPPHPLPNQVTSYYLEDWDTPPTAQGYKGGNFWGIIEKLDYLKDLGINAIYLTPIFQSTCNHRYHTHDYYQVDPLLGGNYAFKEFLTQAHRRNIKVILDGVFNHVGRGFFFFNDILENGPYSAWLDWFRIEGWPISAYDGSLPANYASWVGNRALPQFNHHHPEVREYIMGVGEYWINQGIDGWRLDVPDQIKVEGFWQEFRERVKKINPSAYIVGEIWKPAEKWLDGTQFDGVMNYQFTEATLAFTGGDRIIRQYVELPPYYPYPALTPRKYAQRIHTLLNLYDWEITLTQFNLLASHDTARLLTIAGEDLKTVELATLLLLTFPGAPSIYYGDEVGLPGGFDPDSRRTFPQPQYWNNDLLAYHRQLIALRHGYIALRRGNYESIYADDSVYIFSRRYQDETLIVAINIDTEPQEIKLDLCHFPMHPKKVIFGESTLNYAKISDHEHIIIKLQPRSGAIAL